MAKQFFLTSTNPCVNRLWSQAEARVCESNSFEALVSEAHRHAIGESNCDGCEHYYAITNRATGQAFIMHSLDLVCLYSRKSPWGSCDGGLTKSDHMRQDFLCDAASALGCCVDELLYPFDENDDRF